MRMTREYLKTMHAARRGKPWQVDRAPVQLGLGGDPWRIVVCCALLNQTTNKQVRPSLGTLLALWNTPEQLDGSLLDEERLLNVLRPLGLQNRRARLLRRLAGVWVSDDWATDWDLPTVGPYAHAALSIFVGLDRDVETDDKVLLAYTEALDAGLGLEEDM